MLKFLTPRIPFHWVPTACRSSLSWKYQTARAETTSSWASSILENIKYRINILKTWIGHFNIFSSITRTNQKLATTMKGNMLIRFKSIKRNASTSIRWPLLCQRHQGCVDGIPCLSCMFKGIGSRRIYHIPDSGSVCITKIVLFSSLFPRLKKPENWLPKPPKIDKNRFRNP